MLKSNGFVNALEVVSTAFEHCADKMLIKSFIAQPGGLAYSPRRQQVGGVEGYSRFIWFEGFVTGWAVQIIIIVNCLFVFIRLLSICWWIFRGGKKKKSHEDKSLHWQSTSIINITCQLKSVAGLMVYVEYYLLPFNSMLKCNLKNKLQFTLDERTPSWDIVAMP